MSGQQPHVLSRRAVLRHWGGIAGGLTIAALLEACGPAAPFGATASPTATGAPAAAPAAAKTAAPSTAATRTLAFAEALEPKSYDGINGSVALARQGIGETLVRIGFDSKIEPSLATAVEPVDATTWRFSLRSGVKFHNGNTLDAAAVKASLDRLVSQKDTAHGLQGAVIGVDDASTGRIQTKSPVPHLPALLADTSASILDVSSYAADGTISRPVGTGPFKFAEWRQGERVTLQAHDAYWGGAPKVQAVDYRFIAQPQTRANLLRTGEADITNVIAATDVPALQKTSGVTVLNNPSARLRALYLNTQNGPTSDVRVRQALAHATDRDVIVSTVLENQGTVQAALFRPDYPWSNPAINGLPFDADKARSLLAEAGYTASNPLSLTLLTYNARAELPLIAQVLQQQWSAVGVKCDITVEDYSAIENTAFKEGTHNLALFSRSPLLVYDPQAIYETDFTSTGSYNLSRYSAQDASIKAAGAVTDTAARYDQYRQIEQRIIEQDVPIIVISAYVDVDGVRAGVTGYRQHPTQVLALTSDIARA